MADERYSCLRSNGTEFVLERSKLGLEAGGRRLPRPAPGPAITPPDYVLLGGTDQRSTNWSQDSGLSPTGWRGPVTSSLPLRGPQSQTTTRGPSPEVWYLGSWAPSSSQHFVWLWSGLVMRAVSCVPTFLGRERPHCTSLETILAFGAFIKKALSRDYCYSRTTLGLWLDVIVGEYEPITSLLWSRGWSAAQGRQEVPVQTHAQLAEPSQLPSCIS